MDVTDEQSGEPKEGEYWSELPMATLSSWGHNELIAIEKLIIGRVGYSEITFPEPVDLTGSEIVKQLFGDLARFEDKECCAYPDLDNVDKPPPSSGLNVRVRVELDGCWPIDKATREPIKDESYPPDGQTPEEIEGEGYEVRVVLYRRWKMDFYC